MYYHPVGNKQVAGITRPDSEVQAGRTLRRLRLSKGWSQEEAAELADVRGSA